GPRPLRRGVRRSSSYGLPVELPRSSCSLVIARDRKSAAAPIRASGPGRRGGAPAEPCTRIRSPAPRSELVAHEDRQVDETVGVAPLVVVPADDLHVLAVLDHGQGRVEGAGRRGVDDVGGDDRVLGVLEEALQLALGGLLEGGVDLFL